MPTYSFVLNGEQVSVDVPGDVGLLYVMRDLLGVTGPKYGCGVGVCRACTCHLDGEEFQPCVTPTSMAEGREVTTIEGLADGDTLHPLQEAWIDLDVAQCGYCQPGQIMTAAALLETTSDPSDADIDEIQNICRCGTYFRIRSAIKQAARGATTQSSASAGAGAGSGASENESSQQESSGDSSNSESNSEDEGEGGLLDGLGGGLLGAAAAIQGGRTDPPGPDGQVD